MEKKKVKRQTEGLVSISIAILIWVELSFKSSFGPSCLLKWSELSFEFGPSCLNPRFSWAELSRAELSLGRVVRNSFTRC